MNEETMTLEQAETSGKLEYVSLEAFGEKPALLGANKAKINGQCTIATVNGKMYLQYLIPLQVDHTALAGRLTRDTTTGKAKAQIVAECDIPEGACIYVTRADGRIAEYPLKRNACTRYPYLGFDPAGGFRDVTHTAPVAPSGVVLEASNTPATTTKPRKRTPPVTKGV